jgi:flagellin
LEIKETQEGSIIAVGVASQDVIIRKLDSNFNVTAVQSFARPTGSYFKTGIDVTQTSDGGFLMVGEESYSSPPSPKGFIMKLDANLNLQWEAKEDNTVFSAVVNSDAQHAIVMGNTGLYSVDNTGTITQINADIAQTADSFDYEHDWLNQTADGNYLAGSSDKLYKVTSEGQILWSIDIAAIAVTQIGDRGYIAADSTNSIVKITPEALPASDNNGLQIQTGANAGNTLTLYLNDVSTQALGIRGLDLTTTSHLDTSLAKIDTAIQMVSAERSKLGGYQNALEHISSNVMNAEENLTVAESRIRDVDMAKAMMEFTKFNMLEQVGQSMLVQANQQPQTVLDLLD